MKGYFGNDCESEIGRGVVLVGGDRGVMEVKVYPAACSDVCKVVASGSLSVGVWLVSWYMCAYINTQR